MMFFRSSFVKIISPFFVFGFAHGMVQLPEITIRPQNQDEAFSCIKKLIDRLPFFKKNGYHIKLPALPEFEELLQKDIIISEEEKDKLSKAFYANIYDLSMFDSSLAVLKKSNEIIRNVCEKLLILNINWGFKIFDKYEVLLTLYGPGGRYYFFKNHGFVELLTTARGTFGCHPGYETIIHEIVHLGIEEIIVQKYRLKHWEKERIVDLICSLYLKDLLPKYKVNEKGDQKIDAFVNEAAIVQDLPSAIAQFIKQYPTLKDRHE